MELIDEIITDLECIWDKLWEIDIPSPTVPEYIEHHEQVQSVMKCVSNLSQKYADKHRWMEYRRMESYERSDFIPEYCPLVEVPSAEPEIIRCKDCKHYDDGLCRRWKYSHATSDNSFCSGAERRTDE